MEQVGRKGDVLFVNDSKATNADAAARALACFSDIFWIAGGKAKTGGITASLEGYFPRIRKAYLIGEAAGEFAGTLARQVPFMSRRHARPRRVAARGARRGGRRGLPSRPGAALAGVRFCSTSIGTSKFAGSAASAMRVRAIST